MVLAIQMVMVFWTIKIKTDHTYQCQPVDADGVGKCPPRLLRSPRKYIEEKWYPSGGGKCKLATLPSITFKVGRWVVLNNDSKAYWQAWLRKSVITLIVRLL